MLRDRASRRVIGVLDTKYKEDDRPAPRRRPAGGVLRDALGCRYAFFVYLRPVEAHVIREGPVRIQALGIDRRSGELAGPVRRAGRGARSLTGACAHAGGMMPARNPFPASATTVPWPPASRRSSAAWPAAPTRC